MFSIIIFAKVRNNIDLYAIFVLNIRKNGNLIYFKQIIRMTKKEMIKAMVSHYTDGNKAAFARLLGVPPQTLSSWEMREIFDAELIYRKCKDISAKWLLSCEGAMLETYTDTKVQNMKVGNEAHGYFFQGDGNKLLVPKTDKDIEILEIQIKSLVSENDRLKKDIEDLRITKNGLLSALSNKS